MKNIEDVVAADLCISCGTCVGTSPSDTSRMVLNEAKGIFEPQILDPERFDPTGTAFAACPGKGVRYGELNEKQFGEPLKDLNLGTYESAIAARSADPQRRLNAASGGVMTLIAEHLLLQGKINGATSTRFVPGPRGPRTEVYIANTPELLQQSMGSKYCPTTTGELIATGKETGGPYLFIGTPCQVASLRQAALNDPELDQIFPYTMANFCGGYRDFRYLDGMIRESGLAPDKVEEFRFRGGGWPGSMRAKTTDGSVAEQPYPKFDSDALVNKQYRCTLCVDGTGLLADFACGDAWIDRLRGDTGGWSVILARSNRAKLAIDDMTQTGLLEQLAVEKQEILDSQKFNLESKIDRQSKRMQLHRLLRKPVPSYDVELPPSTSTLWQEFKVVFGKSKPMLMLTIGFKKTRVGRAIRSLKQKLRG